MCSIIIHTHVFVLFLAISRTLKQEQNRIFSRPALHDCSRGGFRWEGAGTVIRWLAKPLLRKQKY